VEARSAPLSRRSLIAAGTLGAPAARARRAQPAPGRRGGKNARGGADRISGRSSEPIQASSAPRGASAGGRVARRTRLGAVLMEERDRHWSGSRASAGSFRTPVRPGRPGRRGSCFVVVPAFEASRALLTIESRSVRAAEDRHLGRERIPLPPALRSLVKRKVKRSASRALAALGFRRTVARWLPDARA